MAANGAGLTIAGKAKECLDLFFECLELLKVSSNTQYWTSLLDQLGRFQIWSSNIGVFADLHTSLDYRLREVSDVRDLTVQLLTSIDDCLQQLREDCKVEPPACSSKAKIADLDIAANSFNEANNAIKESIDWLYRLSNSIRKASSLGQNERAKTFPLMDPDDSTSKDLTPEWINLYTKTIKREFPALAENLRLRLAQSIVLRRKIIMHRQSRHQRWRIQQESYNRKGPKEIDVPRNTPTVAFADPQKSQGRKPPATITPSQRTATTLQPERLKRPKAQASISTALTTPLRMQDQPLIPPPPRAARAGKDFVCDYCCTILNCVEGLDANKWLHHVQKDLNPYVCLFDPCVTSLELYPTSKEWLEHMQKEHAMRWHCVAQDHKPLFFLSQEEFKTHMQTNHPGKFEDEELDYIAASSARPLENIFNDVCPFCGQSPENATVHIGDHLKYLALYTLPVFEEEDDKADVKSSNNLLSKSRTTMERPTYPVEELLCDDSDFPGLTFIETALAFDPSVPDEEVPETYLELLGNRLGNWCGILATSQERKQLDEDDVANDKILSFLHNPGAQYYDLKQPGGFLTTGYRLYLVIKVRNIWLKPLRLRSSSLRQAGDIFAAGYRFYLIIKVRNVWLERIQLRNPVDVVQLKPATLLNTSTNAEAEPPSTAGSSRSHLYNLGRHTNPSLDSIEESPFEFDLESSKGGAGHVTTAILVLTPSGDWRPAKLQFDTGAALNFATEKVVQNYGFTERPIPLLKQRTYTAGNSKFTPRKYIDVEVQVEEYGFNKKVMFIVVPLEDFDLLVGRIFMAKHNMRPLSRRRKLDGARAITSKASSKQKDVEQHSGLNGEFASGWFTTGDFVADPLLRKKRFGFNNFSLSTLVDSVNARRQKWQNSLRGRKDPKGRQTEVAANEEGQGTSSSSQGISKGTTRQTHEYNSNSERLAPQADHQREEGSTLTIAGTKNAFMTAESMAGGPQQAEVSHADGLARADDLNGGSQHYALPPHIDQSAAFLGTVILRTSDGILDSEHMLYDMGSADNIISQTLVEKHRLVPRPIPPQDMRVYDTASGNVFAPRYYVEVDIQDRNSGLLDFTKVSFYVAETLGRCVQMLVGSKFLESRGIRLVAGTGVEEREASFICRSRLASEEAKKDQQLLIEQQARDRRLVLQYIASSSLSPTSGTRTTSEQQSIPSSRTSNPSEMGEDNKRK